MILVTGATGFVGQHFLRRAATSGEAVRCLVRAGSPSLPWVRAQAVEVAQGHLLDAEAVGEACRGARQILHLAAPTNEGNDQAVEQVHQQGMQILVEAARGAGIERVVMVSPLGTAASAGRPFLRSRGLAEDHLRESGLPFVILQSSLMFGRNDHLISRMLRLLQRTGLILIPGTGKTMLQPIWVGDVVSCLLRALSDEQLLDRTIPIGGPQHLSYEEITDQVAKMLNIPRVKIHLSRRMVACMARLLSRVGQNPFLGYRHLELLEVGTITALDAVRRNFGFQPMPLIEGVAYHLMPTTERGAPRPPSGVERGSRTRHER